MVLLFFFDFLTYFGKNLYRYNRCSTGRGYVYDKETQVNVYMKFRKLSENKIHCIISREEMYEKGIEIDDFLEHQDKTEKFLREVLAEARYELGLQDMGYYYSVQMSVMPEGDISLIISSEEKRETKDESDNLEKKLESFKDIMNEARKQLEARREATAESTKQAPLPQAPSVESSGGEKHRDEKIPYHECPIWARTDSLERCISISKNLRMQEELGSALYKYKDDYYLKISFSQKEHQVAATILIVSEYAQDVFTDDQGGRFLEEHGKAICRENAITMLAQL
jgi:adapter protein MecA 1/2